MVGRTLLSIWLQYPGTHAPRFGDEHTFFLNDCTPDKMPMRRRIMAIVLPPSPLVTPTLRDVLAVSSPIMALS